MPSLLGASRWTDAEQRECKRLEKARRLQVYGSGATVRQIVGVTNVAELHCNTLAAQVCPRRLLFRLLSKTFSHCRMFLVAPSPHHPAPSHLPRVFFMIITPWRISTVARVGMAPL